MTNASHLPVEQIRFYSQDPTDRIEYIHDLSYIDADGNVSETGVVTLSLCAASDHPDGDETYGYEIDLTLSAAEALIDRIKSAIEVARS
jgi:hypothetical protein